MDKINNNKKKKTQIILTLYNCFNFIFQLSRPRTIIIEQKYFRYNNQIYNYLYGFPIGGLLSATQTEIYMENFEEKYILTQNNPY